MKDTYVIEIELEREAFGSVTDQQWETFKDRIREECFGLAISDIIERAEEIMAIVEDIEELEAKV